MKFGKGLSLFVLGVILIGALWPAEATARVATASPEVSRNIKILPLATSLNLSTLKFEDLGNTENQQAKPYHIYLEDKYNPGETLTLNVKVSPQNQGAKIEQITLKIFTQKIEAKEYFPNEWVAHYQLPTYIKPGNYSAEVSLLGSPSLNISEKINFDVDHRITEIKITGNKLVSENVIREALNITPGEFYSEIKAEVNRQKILDIGLFSEAKFTRVSRPDQDILWFRVQENPIIRDVEFNGVREFSKPELLKVLNLQAGQLLAYKQLQKDVVRLEKFYKEKSYNFFRILSVEKPTPSNNYTLTYFINEGRIRSIDIAGNDVTKRYVIERELEMRKDDIFSADALKEDLRRVYNLNYFATVEPDLHFDEKNGEVDLTINVKEKKTSSINFGGGYGELQGWFGFADLFLDNIQGTAQSVLLKAQFGQKITSYQFKYFNPWMWPNRTSFTGKLWSTYGSNFLTGERELRNGWQAEVGFQRSLRVRETYSFKYEDVFNTDDHSKNYLDRALGYTISYDDRDQWMNPTKGSYDVFSMEHSTSALGGTIDASRYMLQFNRFYPLADKQVLAGRLMYNYAVGNIFPSDQYYVGSDNTVRGYQQVFAKGLERCIFNLEYRYLFNDMFTGLLFYDIGQAIKPVHDPLDDENGFTNHRGWGSSMGFGLRIITPMGPLRLDFGWPQYQEISSGFMTFNMGQVF